MNYPVELISISSVDFNAEARTSCALDSLTEAGLSDIEIDPPHI